jgi:hypothetical protein
MVVFHFLSLFLKHINAKICLWERNVFRLKSRAKTSRSFYWFAQVRSVQISGLLKMGCVRVIVARSCSSLMDASMTATYATARHVVPKSNAKAPYKT